MHRAAIVVGGLLVAALTLTSCSAPQHPAGQVEAYVEPGEHAVERVRQAAPHVATIGIDGVTLTDDGTALQEPPDGVRRLAEVARAGGARSELLVSNYSSSVYDFSPEVGTRMLADAGNRHAVAEAVARAAERAHVDDVQIDLESLRRRDRADLVAFAEELRGAVHERLGSDARVSMAVMASAHRAEYGDRGYDLRGLAEHVDRFVLMTYDQHGTWSGPGTIGSLPWTREAVTAAVAEGIPRDRLDLGVAGYGYAWPVEDGAGPVTPAAARRDAGDRATWSDATGEWHADLPGGRVLHWSDARSFRVREDLADELGLHGTAMWSLNLSPLAHD